MCLMSVSWWWMRASWMYFSFSVFEVCRVLSGKKNENCFHLLPLSVNHHSSALTLSNVSEQRAGHGLLLAFTTDSRNIHKHMHSHTHSTQPHFFLKLCGQLLRHICRQEEGLFFDWCWQSNPVSHSSKKIRTLTHTHRAGCPSRSRSHIECASFCIVWLI